MLINVLQKPSFFLFLSTIDSDLESRARWCETFVGGKHILCSTAASCRSGFRFNARRQTPRTSLFRDTPRRLKSLQALFPRK